MLNPMSARFVVSNKFQSLSSLETFVEWSLLRSIVDAAPAITNA